jgi:mono/diheme cytochrome c family protein
VAEHPETRRLTSEFNPSMWKPDRMDVAATERYLGTLPFTGTTKGLQVFQPLGSSLYVFQSPGVQMHMIALFGRLPRLALTAAILLGCAIAVSAQDQPAAPLYAAAQAERGQAAYRQSCQDCHGSSLDNGEFGGPPLKGGYFRTRWGQGNVAALYGYVSLAMPPDRPGQLSPQTYADLVAFLLSGNGYPAGEKELPTDPNAQQNMSLKR